MGAKTYKELSEYPDIIMFTSKVNVKRKDGIEKLELVHFIFNDKKESSGLHESVIVDAEYNPLTSNTIYYTDRDEFFALSKYIIRVGLNTTNA